MPREDAAMKREINLEDKVLDNLRKIGESYANEGRPLPLNSILEICIDEGVKIIMEKRLLDVERNDV